MKNQLLGVNVDYLTMDQAVDFINKWLQSRGKHYIVTPNPEMVVDTQSDLSFRKALNGADMAIADSPRLGWGSLVASTKNPFLRLILCPFFLFPQIIAQNDYPIVAGTDLMEELIKLSEEKAYTTAYLGATNKVADKLYKCLRVKYPKLKIVFCSGNVNVNENGEIDFDINKYKMSESKDIKSTHSKIIKPNPHILAQKIDILFVAFGHKKQEKWMRINSPKLNARVMMGVGGAFDYLSGSVPRAPLILRELGLEWVFRLVVQPWRIKRFWKLVKFVYMVMTAKL